MINMRGRLACLYLVFVLAGTGCKTAVTHVCWYPVVVGEDLRGVLATGDGWGALRLDGVGRGGGHGQSGGRRAAGNAAEVA